MPPSVLSSLCLFLYTTLNPVHCALGRLGIRMVIKTHNNNLVLFSVRRNFAAKDSSWAQKPCGRESSFATCSLFRHRPNSHGKIHLHASYAQNANRLLCFFFPGTNKQTGACLTVIFATLKNTFIDLKNYTNIITNKLQYQKSHDNKQSELLTWSGVVCDCVCVGSWGHDSNITPSPFVIYVIAKRYLLWRFSPLDSSTYPCYLAPLYNVSNRSFSTSIVFFLFTHSFFDTEPKITLRPRVRIVIAAATTLSVYFSRKLWARTVIQYT